MQFALLLQSMKLPIHHALQSIAPPGLIRVRSAGSSDIKPQARSISQHHWSGTHGTQRAFPKPYCSSYPVVAGGATSCVGALVLFWHKFVDPILSRILWQNTQDWSGRLCGWSSRPKLQEGTTPSSHFVTSNMCNIARLKIPKDLWCVDAFSGHGAVTKVWSHGPWGVVGLRVHVEMVTCKLFAYGAWSEVGITTKRMVLNDYFRSTNFSITHWVKCRCRFDVCDDQAMDLSTASNA